MMRSGLGFVCQCPFGSGSRGGCAAPAGAAGAGKPAPAPTLLVARSTEVPGRVVLRKSAALEFEENEQKSSGALLEIGNAIRDRERRRERAGSAERRPPQHERALNRAANQSNGVLIAIALKRPSCEDHFFGLRCKMMQKDSVRAPARPPPRHTCIHSSRCTGHPPTVRKCQDELI